jgi:hypothetical protein
MAATRRNAPTPNGKLNSAQSKVVSRSLNTLSIQALNKWVQTARPGQSVQYHVGNLISDREPEFSHYTPEVAAQIDAVASFAWVACVDGFVELYSERLGEGRFVYLVHRTDLPFKDPDHAARHAAAGRPSIH